jgi:hypothetical protein
VGGGDGPTTTLRGTHYSGRGRPDSERLNTADPAPEVVDLVMATRKGRYGAGGGRGTDAD